MQLRVIAVFVLTTLAACSPGENDPAPGATTSSEAKALDDAAAMLDEQRSPPGSDADAGPAPATD